MVSVSTLNAMRFACVLLAAVLRSNLAGFWAAGSAGGATTSDGAASAFWGSAAAAGFGLSASDSCTLMVLIRASIAATPASSADIPSLRNVRAAATMAALSSARSAVPAFFMQPVKLMQLLLLPQGQ